MVGRVGAWTVFVGDRGAVGAGGRGAGQREVVSVMESVDGVGWGIRGRLRISFLYSLVLDKTVFKAE
jgi:hypothetical protein